MQIMFRRTGEQTVSVTARYKLRGLPSSTLQRPALKQQVRQGAGLTTEMKE